MDPWDPRTPLGPFQRVIRDGQLVLEQLEAMDNAWEVIDALPSLTEPERRAALFMAVLHLKRAHGMTDEQFQGWVSRGMPRDADLDD